MFNIGMSEFIVIGALALIFIGPKQLPEVARMVGRLLNELKRAGEEVFGSMNDVRSNARKFMEDTEKQIEEVYKAPEPVIHKGVYKTEEPDPPAPVKVDVADTKLEIAPDEKVKTSAGDGNSGT